MQDIAIYGAGGFGREVAAMISLINQHKPNTWKLLGFFDDGEEKDKQISHFGKILGNIEDLNSWESGIGIVIAIGSPRTLKIVRDKIKNPYVSFPNLIHPNFIINDIDSFSIGVGNIIKGFCSVTTDVQIGDFNMLNGHVNIGHDVTIGDFNVLMPGVRVSGEVAIGTLNLLGAGSFVKQRLKIGEGVKLSPLSALLTHPKDNALYIGNPAKKTEF